jgi:hypothetical protein
MNFPSHMGRVNRGERARTRFLAAARLGKTTPRSRVPAQIEPTRAGPYTLDTRLTGVICAHHVFARDHLEGRLRGDRQRGRDEAAADRLRPGVQNKGRLAGAFADARDAHSRDGHFAF